MGEYNRNGLFLIGGVVLGVVATAVLGQQKDRLRPAVADLISRGLDAKDQALVAVETVKEHAEDLLAEAEDLRQKRAEPLPSGADSSRESA